MLFRFHGFAMGRNRKGAYIRGIQVFALNMIESPCTERYARWCERGETH